MNGRLKRLWAKGQVCYWCGRPTKIYKPEPGEKLPDDTATIDHIFPLNHPMRTSYKKAKKESPCVLACLRCNNERGNRTFSQQKVIAFRRYPTGTPNAQDIEATRAKAEQAKPKVRLLRDRKPRMKGFKR